jgi:hypothetical protein
MPPKTEHLDFPDHLKETLIELVKKQRILWEPKHPQGHLKDPLLRAWTSISETLSTDICFVSGKDLLWVPTRVWEGSGFHRAIFRD